MPIKYCNVEVNAQGEETQNHGTFEFPVAGYRNNLIKASVPWHWHEELEIIWVISGSVKVYIDSTEYIVGANQGIFINSELLHSVEANISKTVEPNISKTEIDEINLDNQAKIQSIVFHPRIIGNYGSLYWQNYIEPLIYNKTLPMLFLSQNNSSQEKIIQLGQEVWQNLNLAEPGFEIFVRNKLSEIILHLLQNNPNKEDKLNNKNFKNSKRIKIMLQYMHKNFDQKISVKDLSLVALISESEVLRCFKQTIRSTPNQYLIQYRIQQACNLLKNTDATSLEISLDCGFPSNSYFTKTFKKIIGCTPIQYREKCTNNPC